VRALAEVGRALATGLTSLANVLSPEAIVLGGYFATFAEWLVPRIERELHDHVLGARWSRCAMLVSELGDQAALRGAAALALHEVLADPASVHCANFEASRPSLNQET
jgi:predicted NBD/HSP70 family sugar kinase